MNIENFAVFHQPFGHEEGNFIYIRLGDNFDRMSWQVQGPDNPFDVSPFDLRDETSIVELATNFHSSPLVVGGSR